MTELALPLDEKAERWFVKKPCQHCPFRSDVRPFLYPERAEEIAEASWNPYNSFSCHKTLEYDDDEGDPIATADSLECAGFLTMQIEYGGKRPPEGFEPAHNVYSDPAEMVEAYRDEWESRRRRK